MPIPEDQLHKDVHKLVKQTLSVFGPLLKWAINVDKFTETIVGISSKFVESKIKEYEKNTTRDTTKI